MTYLGEVKNGVIVLEPGAALGEGTIVRVEPVASESGAKGASGRTDDERRRAAAARVSDEQLSLLRRATEPAD